MSTTYVYATNSLSTPLNVTTSQSGPNGNMDLTLKANQIPAQSSKFDILEVGRMAMSGAYVADLNISSGGNFIAALQIMLSGHGPGSDIWWRWRLAGDDIGVWTNDHDPHSIQVIVNDFRYLFTLQGQSSVGYDDISISISANNS